MARLGQPAVAEGTIMNLNLRKVADEGDIALIDGNECNSPHGVSGPAHRQPFSPPYLTDNNLLTDLVLKLPPLDATVPLPNPSHKI